MDLRKDHFTRTAHPPAKLNLFLEILGRRADGFHELATLMVPVRLFDSLSISPSAHPGATSDRDLSLRVRTLSNPNGESADGRAKLPLSRSLDTRLARQEPRPPASETASSPIPADDKNLVIRALRLLAERSGRPLTGNIELVKRIPAAAGLGGGSSDAAAALQLANQAWRLGWSREQLAAVGAEIGSDVPFFVYGGPAVCRGRGELVEKLPPLPRLHFVVVKPPANLNTADVYHAYAAHAGEQSASDGGKRLKDLIAALLAGRLTEIGHWMRNVLEAPAAALSPWVGRLRSAFNELDCVAHQLSGSGSAYFGVCRHAQHARRIATVLRARRLGLVFAVRSCP